MIDFKRHDLVPSTLTDEMAKIKRHDMVPSTLTDEIAKIKPITDSLLIYLSLFLSLSLSHTAGRCSIAISR
jgi:hypothetical protein